MNRREALGLIATGTACSVMTPIGVSAGPGVPAVPAGVAAGQHRPKPLPFDPTKLRGVSEKLIVSHHDNNYAGAVKNLNKVEEELARVTADIPGFVVGGLKERELT